MRLDAVPTGDVGLGQVHCSADKFPRWGIITPTAPTRIAGPVAWARVSICPELVGQGCPLVRLGRRSGRLSKALTVELVGAEPVWPPAGGALEGFGPEQPAATPDSATSVDAARVTKRAGLSRPLRPGPGSDARRSAHACIRRPADPSNTRIRRSPARCRRKDG